MWNSIISINYPQILHRAATLYPTFDCLSKKTQETTAPIFKEMTNKSPYAQPIAGLNPALLNDIFSGKTPIQIEEGDPEFKTDMHRCFEKLGESEIGGELLERICKSKQPLPIRKSSRTEFCLWEGKARIDFSPDQTLELTASESDGRRYHFTLPSFIALGHEMIHFLHFQEEGKLLTYLPGKDVFPGFPNVEEEYTITGKKRDEFTENNTSHSISEHALCEAYQIPKRDVYGFFLPQTIDETYRWGGFSALHLAVSRGEIDTVKSLISQNANVNLQAFGSRGRTPLMCAIQYEHPEIASELLDSGANPKIRDIWGRTALDYVSSKSKSTFRKLELQLL